MTRKKKITLGKKQSSNSSKSFLSFVYFFYYLFFVARWKCAARDSILSRNKKNSFRLEKRQPAWPHLRARARITNSPKTTPMQRR
jgi:hypothetical protein